MSRFAHLATLEKSQTPPQWPRKNMSVQKSSLIPHPYSNQTIVLTTKHEKHSLIAPILEAELNLKVVLHEADTDQLGTFTGEMERTLPPRDAAIEKAKLGMRELGASLGIASEGSIGPDPLMPFTRSDIEYIALVDLERGIEIVERFRSFEIIAGEIVTEPGSDISSFLTSVDFPNHKLIAQPNGARGKHSIKGLANQSELEKAIEDQAAISSDGKAFLQSDLRAHCSPSRQQNIIQATRLLAKRVSALCPSCGTPGFGVTRYEQGLECSECGELVSNALKFEILGCAKCSFEEAGPQLADYADPSTCDGCNP
jgi:ribosomal protein L37AE/L43A